MSIYREDLAYIHDAGFSDYAREAAPGLLALLRRHGVRGGLVVDLGCGSGVWAGELHRTGYRVLGVDQSAAMIRQARRRAPACRFVTGSLYTARIPSCDAVTSIGECLNYSGPPLGALRSFFARVYAALRPGGVFVFDFAEPARIARRKDWREGPDWAILVQGGGDWNRKRLTRRIVCYRKIGRTWRRSEETHSLRLYEADAVAGQLTRVGFEVRTLDGYGRRPLPAGIASLVACRK